MFKQYTMNGKMVGEVRNDTYYTTRTAKIHYFIKGKGYPISEKIIQDLTENGITKIKIKEIGVKAIRYFECDVVDYYCSDVFQEGKFDAQRCYPLRQMRMVK